MEIKATLSVAQPDILIEDEQLLELPGWDFRAVWTPGHSPGHICLYSDHQKLLLSGDHVLPRITPNISFHSQQFANPLGDYLESLAKVRALHPDEVLPAHEYRFSGLDDRVDALIGAPRRPIGRNRGILEKSPGISCWDITLALSWSRPWDDIHDYMQRAANGETLAHLVLLEQRGRVTRESAVPLASTCPSSPAAAVAAAVALTHPPRDQDCRYEPGPEGDPTRSYLFRAAHCRAGRIPPGRRDPSPARRLRRRSERRSRRSRSACSVL